MHEGDPHYQMIWRYYGTRLAARSGVPLMSHIDEGLVILAALGASLAARRAFCLHPILQCGGALDGPVDPEAEALAVEYVKVANETLSTRPIASAEEIRLSEVPEVNDMLIADKVQNRKDFERYHEATHPRSAALARYFRLWLARLGVSEARYQELVALISSSR